MDVAVYNLSSVVNIWRQRIRHCGVPVARE